MILGCSSFQSAFLLKTNGRIDFDGDFEVSELPLWFDVWFEIHQQFIKAKRNYGQIC